MLLVPKIFNNLQKKEKFFKLSCECNSMFMNERQATEIIEQMYACDNCDSPVFLVAKVKESD